MGASLARIVAILCCAWLPGVPASAQAQDIVIGVIAGISGAGASYGAGIVQGAEMAVQDVNAAGGIAGSKLRLLVADDASEPARSAIAMRRLVAANPDLIVGGWGSAQVLANMDYAEQSAVPYIVVGATNPRITSERNQWIFRVIPSDSAMADQLARLAAVDLRLRHIAVIYDSNAYGTGNRDVFVAALRRFGVKVGEVLPYETSDSDFRSQLLRIQASAPEAIAIFGTLPAAPAVMRQARALGIKARFLGTGGLANDALMAAAGTAAEGTLLTSFFSAETDAEAKAWSERYQSQFASRRFNSPVLGAWEYRTIRDIAVPCLRSAGRDKRALRACIAGWRGKLFGVTTAAWFDRSGQLVQPPLVVEVRDGAFRLFRGDR